MILKIIKLKLRISSGFPWIKSISVLIIIPFLFLLTTVWSIYHFAYIARFENGFKESFKISFVFMILNLGWSIVMILLCAAILVLLYYIPFLILFAPGLFACGLHPFLEKVFRKYMTPEDLAKEEELY